MGENAWQGSSVYHIPSRAAETSQLCCQGTKARPDVFEDLNISLHSSSVWQNSVNSNVNLKLFPIKVDIKSVIRDYSLIKAILAVRPKRKGREEMRIVCDTEITETLCLYFNIEHPDWISSKINAVIFFKRCLPFQGKLHFNNDV